MDQVPSWDQTNPIDENQAPSLPSQQVAMAASPSGTPSWNDTFDPEEKYGGVTGELTTAGLGALSGATFGTSNYALTRSGLVSPETIKGFQETNPKSNFTGEVAGTIGSLIYAPEFSPAALVGKVGKAAEGLSEVAALKASGQAMEALGLSGSARAAKVLSTASDLGSKALGSAVEGALYSGLGNTMNEYALGDPQKNGESLASVFGHNLAEGALYGAALGGALRAGTTVLPEAVSGMKTSLGDFKDYLLGKGVDGESGKFGDLLDKFDDTGKLSQSWGDRVTNAAPDLQEGIIRDSTAKLNDVLRNTKTALSDFNGRIRPAAVDALIDTADKKAVLQGQQSVLDNLQGAIQTIKENPGIYDQNAAAKLEKYHTQLTEGLSDDSPASIFNRVRDVQQKIGDWGRGVVANTQTADTKALLNDVSNSTNAYLKDPDVFGLVGSNLAEHNQMLARVYDFTPAFEKKSNFISDWMTNVGTNKAPKYEFDPKKVARIFKSGDEVKLDRLNNWFDTIKDLPEHIENTAAAVPNEGMDKALLDNLEASHQEVLNSKDKFQEVLASKKGTKINLPEYAAATIAAFHPILGGALELYNLASRPLETINKLAEIERVLNKGTNLLSRGAKSIFDNSIKAAIPVRGQISAIMSRDDLEAHKKERDNIASFANDPAQMIDKISSATEGLHNIAPDTALSLQGVTARAAQFLSQKLPQQSSIAKNPFSEEYEPSRSELSKFRHYQMIVESPLQALNEVKNLTIGPDTIETLNTVYPQLYQEMKNVVLNEATDHLRKSKSIDYQKKQALSFFLGSPLDDSMTFQSVMQNQQAFQPVQNTNQALNPKPSKTGMQKMSLADRTGINHGNFDT